MGSRHVMLKDRMASLEHSLFVVAVWALAGVGLGCAIGFAQSSLPIWACVLAGAAVGILIGVYAGWGRSTLALLLRIPAYAIAMIVGLVIHS